MHFLKGSDTSKIKNKCDLNMKQEIMIRTGPPEPPEVKGRRKNPICVCDQCWKGGRVAFQLVKLNVNVKGIK